MSRNFISKPGIAACHCAAACYERTDWKTILFFYDLLLERNGSPVIALNRAVVISRLHGAAAGLSALGKIAQRDNLAAYHSFHAVRGELHRALQQSDKARAAFARGAEPNEHSGGTKLPPPPLARAGG